MSASRLSQIQKPDGERGRGVEDQGGKAEAATALMELGSRLPRRGCDEPRGRQPGKTLHVLTSSNPDWGLALISVSLLGKTDIRL